MEKQENNERVVELRDLIKETKKVLRGHNIERFEDVIILGEDLLLLYKELFKYGDDDDKRFSCRECALFVLPVSERLLQVKEVVDKEEVLQRAYGLYRGSYAFVSRRSLSHFIDFMEWDRTSHNKIYFNRKEVLEPLVYYLNKMVFDSKLQFVIASFPPSYGKTFVVNYFSAWLYGLKFDSSVLRISYSEDLVLASSRSVKELVGSELFSEVFENFKMLDNKVFDKSKESDWKLIGSDVLTSHYARTREGAITGVRANAAIIVDDITKGESESTNSTLHLSMYNKWSTEWKNRRSTSDVMYIFVGTMWSPEDILNRIVEERVFNDDELSDGRFKYSYVNRNGDTAVIRVPLLDEDDKSTCEIVMSTEEALRLRETTDEYLFSCVYQQNPIAPSGLEFAWENLNTYGNFPTNLPNYSLAVLDPARKGKDNVSMPIFKIGENENHFMVDVLFQKKSMDQLYDEIVDLIIVNNVTTLVIENNIDTSLSYVISEKLKERDYPFCTIIDKFATANKEQRIMAARGAIVRKMFFKEKSKLTLKSDYGRFMENLTRYSFDYANKHDDAPDSCALYVNEIILKASKPRKPQAVDRTRLGF